MRAPLASAAGALYAVSVDGVVHALGGPMPALPELQLQLGAPASAREASR
ncbi:MAG: hypothetical protein LC624_08190 [Halobacteriales archaeon]|nr:hypothetical protein [Halobacteriales archaeon]